MNDLPTPRQVLYALVAGGFLVIVGVLIVGAAVAGLVPTWWTIVTAVSTVLITGWTILNWRRTGPVLLYSIGLLALWTIGTLMLA